MERYPSAFLLLSRGAWRIRTAVDGFAAGAKVGIIFEIAKFLDYFLCQQSAFFFFSACFCVFNGHPAQL